jgi:hypothetical protein
VAIYIVLTRWGVKNHGLSRKSLLAQVRQNPVERDPIACPRTLTQRAEKGLRKLRPQSGSGDRYQD